MPTGVTGREREEDVDIEDSLEGGLSNAGRACAGGIGDAERPLRTILLAALGRGTTRFCDDGRGMSFCEDESTDDFRARGIDVVGVGNAEIRRESTRAVMFFTLEVMLRRSWTIAAFLLGFCTIRLEVIAGI